MPKLSIKLIAVDIKTNKEVVLASIESSKYDDQTINIKTKEIFDQVRDIKPDLKRTSKDLELSVRLSAAPEEDIRPSFHLDKAIIKTLAELEVDVDFDPYT